MRPSRPEPVILVGSSPCSSTIFLADGISRASCRASAALGAGVGATEAGSGLTTGGGAAPAVVALASVSMVAMTSPDLTLPPSALITLTRTPSAGAGSSITILSVSISIRFSSRATASPTFLCHASNVASATDSDNCGTLTSTSMIAPFGFSAGSGLALPRVLQKLSA